MTTSTPPPNRLAALLASEAPTVAVSHGDEVDAEQVSAARDLGVDVVELRVDRFDVLDVDHVTAVVGRCSALPVLATVRHVDEGGSWTGDERDRAALVRALLPVVDGVDVELARSGGPMAEVVAEARSLDRTVVLSHHDFTATPTRPRLDAMADEASAAGADHLKVAVAVHTPSDVRTLASFTIDHAHEAPITIAMGDRGSVSRVFFPALGSRLTYAFVSEHQVPGQLDVVETLQLLGRFYPERRR